MEDAVLLSGLSSCFAAVADATADSSAVEMAAATTTAACGLSYCSSAAADGATAMAVDAIPSAKGNGTRRMASPANSEEGIKKMLRICLPSYHYKNRGWHLPAPVFCIIGNRFAFPMIQILMHVCFRILFFPPYRIPGLFPPAVSHDFLFCADILRLFHTRCCHLSLIFPFQASVYSIYESRSLRRFAVYATMIIRMLS